jgi:hypothetical protein
MAKKVTSHFLLFLVALLLLFLSSCFLIPSNTNQNNVAVRGNLSAISAFQNAAAEKAATGPPQRAISDAVMHIGSVAVIAGQIQVSGIDEIDTTPVGIDGSFQADLAREDDKEYLLPLLDLDAPSHFDTLLGFIGVSPAEGTTLDVLPVESTQDDIDLGTLYEDRDDAIALTDAATAQGWFGIEINEIIKKAILDDTMKQFKNEINNTNEETGEYFTVGNRTLLSLSIEGAINRFSDVGPPYDVPTNIPEYQGFIARRVGISVINAYDHVWMDVEVGIITVEIYPDVEIFSPWYQTYYGPENPLILTDEDVYAHDNPDFDKQYAIGIDVRDADPVTYNIFYDGEKRASLETGYFNPMDENDNYRYLHPSLKVTVNDQSVITELEMKFYLYDPIARNYKELTREEVLEYCGPSFGISTLPGYDNSVGQEWDDTFAVTDFDYTFVLEGTPGEDYVVDRIGITTWLGGEPQEWTFNNDINAY